MLYIIIGIFVLFSCFYLYEANKKYKHEHEIEEANNKLLEEEKRKEERIKKEAKERATMEKYGKRSDYLDLLGFSISVYNSSKTIIVNGKDFSFDEITGCTFREEKRSSQGKQQLLIRLRQMVAA